MIWYNPSSAVSWLCDLLEVTQLHTASLPHLSRLGDNSARASGISASLVTAFVLDYLFKDICLANILGR